MIGKCKKCHYTGVYNPKLPTDCPECKMFHWWGVHPMVPRWVVESEKHLHTDMALYGYLANTAQEE